MMATTFHHQGRPSAPAPASALSFEDRGMMRAASSLIDLGSELLAAKCGCENEAMAIYDAAHSLITVQSPSVRAWEQAAKHFQVGTQLLRAHRGNFSTTSGATSSKCSLEQDIGAAPDLYQEDECDVGPRILRTPIRTDDSCVQNGLLLEAIILFNKGLVYHSKDNVAEARQLYEVVVFTVQTLFSGQVCAAAAMELAMRSYNNLGLLHYCEGNETLAISSFETSLHFAKYLADFSKNYRLEYANVLSNWCRTHWMRGDISEILYQRLREVLRIRTRILSWDHLDVAASRYNIAAADYARQDGQKAAAHLLQYLSIAAHRSSVQSLDDIDALPALIMLLLIQNEDKNDHASQELVRGLRALQEKRHDLGPNTLEVASVLNFVGTSLFHLQDFEHALIFFQEELRLEDKSFSEDALGADESNSISVTCNNIGRILQELGRFQEAINYYERALQGEYGDIKAVTHASIKDSSVASAAEIAHSSSQHNAASPADPSSPINLYSTIWYNLGLIHDKLGSHNEAINAFKMSLELRRAMFGPDHSDIACLLYNIGVLQMEQGRLEDASASFREALRIRRVDATGQLNDQHVIKTLEKLASLHKAKGNIYRALEATREILAVQEVSAEYDPATRVKEMGIMLRSVAELYQDANDLYKAVEVAKECVQMLRRAVEARSCANKSAINGVSELIMIERFACVEQFASSLLLLGSLYHELGEPIEASKFLQEAATVVYNAKAQAELCPPGLRPSALFALQEVTASLAICHCAAVA